MTTEIALSIMEILEQSKEDGKVSDISMIDNEVLGQLGLPNSTPFSINRIQRIDIGMIAVNHGASISEIVNHLTWKDFEGFVAGILSENNYRCIESFRRRGNAWMPGMEIDVVGVKGSTIIAIDAKMWGVRGGKAAALKTAAEKQKKRTSELTSDLDRLFEKLNTISQGPFRIFPAIVTWLVEEVELHEGVPVVPVFKLNSFILDLDHFEDIIVSYSS
jgi:hypothetical protein